MSAKAMRKMGKKVEAMLPRGFGFVILVFPFGGEKEGNYISNAKREDMVKALRETADRLEKKQDYKTPEDNIYS